VSERWPSYALVGQVMGEKTIFALESQLTYSVRFRIESVLLAQDLS